MTDSFRQHYAGQRRVHHSWGSPHPGSLGLHPAVYFWGATGRFQPTAFLAIVALIKELDKTNGFKAFTSARGRLEEMLLKYKFVTNIVHRTGAFPRGLGVVLKMYKILLSGIADQKTDEQILGEIATDPRLKFLSSSVQDVQPVGKDFSSEIKSAAHLRELMPSAVKCKECGGLIHVKSSSVDHEKRKRDGGMGNLENARLTHVYCNTTYKQ